jgi:Asp-tRNA(Asn)/Glu-tRNA(Gln) amidotransferase A subunit family amidase
LGYPVLSLPVFWDDGHGLPFGLQIIAPKFADLPLMDFGEEVLASLKDDRSSDRTPGI